MNFFQVFLQAVFIAIQYFAGFTAFKRTNNTGGFQLIYDPACPVIAQFKFTLYQ